MYSKERVKKYTNTNSRSSYLGYYLYGDTDRFHVNNSAMIHFTIQIPGIRGTGTDIYDVVSF